MGRARSARKAPAGQATYNDVTFALLIQPSTVLERHIVQYGRSLSAIRYDTVNTVIQLPAFYKADTSTKFSSDLAGSVRHSTPSSVNIYFWPGTYIPTSYHPANLAR